MDEHIAQLLSVLDDLGIDWCVIGAHAVGVYTQPRATLDLDLLVDDRRMPKILAALADAMGDVDADDIGPAVRLRALEVDLVRASSNDVFRRVLGTARKSGDWRLPTVEGLLVLKFMALTSPFRGLDRRRQDMVDFIALYRATDPADLDRDGVKALARLLYDGDGDELVALLDKIDRDEPLQI